MAGFVPGLLPTNHSQEKEFAQAYEDVLERYKGHLHHCGLGTEAMSCWVQDVCIRPPGDLAPLQLSCILEDGNLELDVRLLGK
ncbi:unnamed protein product [Arctogadus glacialis]